MIPLRSRRPGVVRLAPLVLVLALVLSGCAFLNAAMGMSWSSLVVLIAV